MSTRKTTENFAASLNGHSGHECSYLDIAKDLGITYERSVMCYVNSHRSTACTIITEEHNLCIKAMLCTELHITKVKAYYLIQVMIEVL